MSSEPLSEPRHVSAWLSRLRESARDLRAKREAAAPAIAAAEARIREEAATRRNTLRLQHLEACGVDERTRAAFAGGGLKATPALQGVVRWLAQDARPVLVLRGGYGSGKSVAAARVLLEAKRRTRVMAHPLADEPVTVEDYDSRAGMWTTAARLRFASRFGEGREWSPVERAAVVPWLVLDELREEDGEGKGQARLEEVLSERYARQLRTVITTNLGQEPLRALLGERLASRYAEGAMVVDAGDADLRRARQ